MRSMERMLLPQQDDGTDCHANQQRPRSQPSPQQQHRALPVMSFDLTREVTCGGGGAAASASGLQQDDHAVAWLTAGQLMAVNHLSDIPDDQLARADLSDLTLVTQRFGRKAMMDARKRAKNRLSARQFAEQRRMEADYLSATNALLLRQNDALVRENTQLREENTQLRYQNSMLTHEVSSLQASLAAMQLQQQHHPMELNSTALDDLPDFMMDTDGGPYADALPNATTDLPAVFTPW